MSAKYTISALLHSLYKLHYKISKIDLRRRLGLYHPHTYTDAPDIAAPLAKHIDKLASKISSKPGSETAHAASSRSTDIPAKRYHANPPDWQPTWLKTMVASLRRPHNISASKQASDQTMGEKLKDSTWSHIHTALMQARKGDVSTAKLHAGIANGALKEAAHYMSEADYKLLCAEVKKSFEELDDL